MKSSENNNINVTAVAKEVVWTSHISSDGVPQYGLSITNSTPLVYVEHVTGLWMTRIYKTYFLSET